MQNPLVCEERMTVDDKSLFCMLGSVTLLFFFREERMPWNFSFSVCISVSMSEQKQYWMAVYAHSVLARCNENTHVQNMCVVCECLSRLLEMRGSSESFAASDTPCSLLWEHWSYCFFSCCDHPFVYPLKHSLFFYVSLSSASFHSFSSCILF